MYFISCKTVPKDAKTVLQETHDLDLILKNELIIKKNVKSTYKATCQTLT